MIHLSLLLTKTCKDERKLHFLNADCEDNSYSDIIFFKFQVEVGLIIITYVLFRYKILIIHLHTKVFNIFNIRLPRHTLFRFYTFKHFLKISRNILVKKLHYFFFRE